MWNKARLKYTLVLLSSLLFITLGFLSGVFVLRRCSFLAVIFGAHPNRFIAIFLMLPSIILFCAIFAFLGILLWILAWKPFLSPDEAKEYFRADESEINPQDPWIIKIFLKMIIKIGAKFAELIYGIGKK